MLPEQHGRQIRGRAVAGGREQLLPEEALQEHLLLEPYGHRRDERANAARSEGQIRLEEALELHERLVVERDVTEIAESDAALGEAVAERVGGESRVVPLAREPLLLRCRHDRAVPDQARRAVVVEGRNAEDVRRQRSFPKATRAGARASSARTLSARHV